MRWGAANQAPVKNHPRTHAGRTIGSHPQWDFKVLLWMGGRPAVGLARRLMIANEIQRPGFRHTPASALNEYYSNTSITMDRFEGKVAMNTRNPNSVVGVLLVASCLGAVSSHAQDIDVSGNKDVPRYEKSFNEVCGHDLDVGEHQIDGYRFRLEVALGSSVATPDPSEHASIKGPSHFIGGGGDKESILDLNAEPAHLVPGHVMIGGEWQHSPGDTVDGHSDHYVSGIFFPF